MSADQVWFGPSGRKSRSSRSAATLTPGSLTGRAPPLARQQPRDTGCSHQPLHALATDGDPVLEPQLGVDPAGAIGAVRRGVDPVDLLGQPRVRQRPVRRRATLPIMEAGAVHFQHAAHHSPPPGSSPSQPRSARRSLLRLAGFPGEKSGRLLEDLALHPQRLISRRNRASSSRSSLERPSGRLPSSRSACLTQLRNVTSEIPRSSAI